MPSASADSWLELTPEAFLDRFPPPASMTETLNKTDAARARRAYAHYCLDAMGQVAEAHGRCRLETTEFIAEKVSEVMGQLIHEGEMRGTLH